ncbi:unnamed protein product [Ixodes pacificus]
MLNSDAFLGFGFLSERIFTSAALSPCDRGAQLPTRLPRSITYERARFGISEAMLVEWKCGARALRASVTRKGGAGLLVERSAPTEDCKLETRPN